MIQLGAKLDSQDAEILSTVASSEGDIEMVKLLHEAKADLNKCGHDGTALHRAVLDGHTKMLKVIHDKPTLDVFCYNELVG